MIIIGGGPTGATSGIVLSQGGLKVLIIEKDKFPRFHVGESLLPVNMKLFRDLGVEEKILSQPHREKLGVEIAFGHEETSKVFHFRNGLIQSENKAINIERSILDSVLVEFATNQGAEVLFGTAVERIEKLEDRNVVIKAGKNTFKAKFLIDASGQGTFIGNRFGKKNVNSKYKKIAYFGHFYQVKKNPKSIAGYPSIIMMNDCWFWIIPLDREKTSIGVVMDQKMVAQIRMPSKEILRWSISNCPLMEYRCLNAKYPDKTYVAADFSYFCNPIAGPGYFLVGDAGKFVDPVFSTGVCLGMMGARNASENIIAILKDGRDVKRARTEYKKFVEDSSSVLFRLVNRFYSHHFREILAQDMGPLNIHRAIISILAGNVFPKTPWALYWRFMVFNFFTRYQKLFPLAPRRMKKGILSQS